MSFGVQFLGVWYITFECFWLYFWACRSWHYNQISWRSHHCCWLYSDQSFIPYPIWMSCTVGRLRLRELVKVEDWLSIDYFTHQKNLWSHPLDDKKLFARSVNAVCGSFISRSAYKVVNFVHPKICKWGCPRSVHPKICKWGCPRSACKRGQPSSCQDLQMRTHNICL